MVATRRVALSPHEGSIRRWVEEGRSDAWIAQELKTTTSSVQSFRSRNAIYRRDPVRRGQLAEHPAVLQEMDGAIVVRAEVRQSELFETQWRPYLECSPEDLRVIVTRDGIYVEKVNREPPRR